MTPVSSGAEAASLVGRRVLVDIGSIAHGGHCVARHEGRVVFVRHGIPGETALVEITEGRENSRFLRGDVVEVTSPSADRVAPPCPYAGPGRCGGCDFQHVSLLRQRELLAEVVQEQLARLAGVHRAVTVEPVSGDEGGLGWRTRVRFSATTDALPGLHTHRSHEVVAVDRCLIAAPDLPDVGPVFRAGAESAVAVRTSTGDRVVVVDVPVATQVVTEEAAGRRWDLSAGDFWQVHPGAADALVEAVLDGVQPRPGERCWDLYAGVGLFSGALAQRVGESGEVFSVEELRRASDHARSNLRDLPAVRTVAQRVQRFVVSRAARARPDIVVLDPPRAGAGSQVLAGIVAREPRVIAYVGCDPASLARDIATLGRSGYELVSLRAFDIFPMTSHVECVALLERTGPDLRRSDSR